MKKIAKEARRWLKRYPPGSPEHRLASKILLRCDSPLTQNYCMDCQKTYLTPTCPCAEK